MKAHSGVMDKVYRIQRHFYDATRRLFLPGRDTLLKAMRVPVGGRVLEIGCGTGRNLIKLKRRFPEATFFGIDISAEMLRTAERKIRQSGRGAIQVAQADAETFQPRTLFKSDAPFDAVFFSYSLTMIPDWRKAVDLAAGNLSENGSLYVVDFWDQRGWPRTIREMLVRWLKVFHVRYENGMVEHLKRVADERRGTLELRGLFGGYAFLAIVRGGGLG